MPPRRRHLQEPNPEQGAFIVAEVVSSGSTDPNTHQQIGRIVAVTPEGFFPDEVTPSEGVFRPEVAVAEQIAEQTKTANRRRAQVGKHSPLRRDGTYLTIVPGDVLPPNEVLGVKNPVIVKDSNFDQAKVYAARLEAIRLEHILRNPTLDTLRVSDVIQVVADKFDLNKALRATRQLGKPQEEAATDDLPRFNTLAKRLGVIIDEAAQARFVPASRTEITVALPLMDRRDGQESSVSDMTHNHLMETYDATKKIVSRKGHSSVVQEWYADRAYASRCYEMIDFYTDAETSLDALTDFAELLKRAEGDEAKKDSISSHYHPAMGVMMRHIVAYRLKDDEVAEEDLLFRPMTAAENRTGRPVELPSRNARIGGKQVSAREFEQAKQNIEQMVRQRAGDYSNEAKMRRNKTLITPFTNPDMPDATREFIHSTFANIDLNDLRALFPLVVEKQKNRQQFWYAALRGVKGKYKTIVAATLDEGEPR